MQTWLRRNFLVLGYVVCATVVMLGYVRYDPYQLDGDAISYMDIASSLIHHRWREAINGLWNPGYPALLAIAEKFHRGGRAQELGAFYWVNYAIFIACLACTWFFVRGVLQLRVKIKQSNQDEMTWALSDSLVYLASFSIIFLSWLQEFSLGKIRVDGLFASLLLLAFGSIVRALDGGSRRAYAGAGALLGIAYLVKSPGFVIALLSLLLMALALYRDGKLKASAWKLALASITFFMVCGPYIAVLSLQKHRPDFGDSARLNYAWCVDGTAPQHLLNNQPARFGNSHVELKHSEIELMTDPVVVSFNQFPHATYAPWFDPSYFNEGITPHFVLRRQIHVIIQESHHLLLFVMRHGEIFILLALCFAWGAKASSDRRLRGVLMLFSSLAVLCALMYLSVKFLDRYVAGLFWPFSIALLAFFTMRENTKRGMISGAAIFMALAILLSGARNVIKMREAVIFAGKTSGWYSPTEYETARKLADKGVTPGSALSCFRACNTGTYWARLASVRITSEIYDPNYMSDTMDGNSSWNRLPNKQEIFDVLRASGSKGIVGLFESPPAADEGWEHLDGLYYFHRL